LGRALSAIMKLPNRVSPRFEILATCPLPGDLSRSAPSSKPRSFPPKWWTAIENPPLAGIFPQKPHVLCQELAFGGL
jgi:hypothetical protein